MYLIFDIGGSSTKTAVIDHNGSLIFKGKVTLRKNMEEFLDVLHETAIETMKNYKIEGIAISSPGRVNSSTGEVYGLSALGYLHEENFAMRLQEKHKIPVSIINDANAAALAEMTFAKVKEKDVCFVIIGSGVGGAIIREGKLIEGRRGEAGEFGYMYLKKEKKGQKNFSQMATLQNASRRLKERYGFKVYAKDLFEDYLKGKSPQREIVEESFYYLCVGLYNIQYSLDPEVIYIGGAVSQDERYINEIRKYLKSDEFKDADIKIRAVTYYNDNNLLGAYAHHMQMMKEGRKLCIPSE